MGIEFLAIAVVFAWLTVEVMRYTLQHYDEVGLQNALRRAEHPWGYTAVELAAREAARLPHDDMWIDTVADEYLVLRARYPNVSWPTFQDFMRQEVIRRATQLTCGV